MNANFGSWINLAMTLQNASSLPTTNWNREATSNTAAQNRQNQSYQRWTNLCPLSPMYERRKSHIGRIVGSSAEGYINEMTITDVAMESDRYGDGHQWRSTPKWKAVWWCRIERIERRSECGYGTMVDTVVRKDGEPYWNRPQQPNLLLFLLLR